MLSIIQGRLTLALVFLESIISLITEYKTTISTSLGRLGQQSRTLSIWLCDFVKHHIALMFAASLVILLMCYYIGRKAHTARHKTRPRVSTLKSLDRHTFPNEYYVDNRLRSGKRFLDLSPDRFRRAATVC